METFNLHLYNDMILSIKRGGTSIGKSNAKPFFLLSIIECILMDQLKQNEIRYNDENISYNYYAYARFYNEVGIAPITVPYYHMITSGFYKLLWKSDNRPKFSGTTPSGKYLREHLLYAKLDDELWELLQKAENREYFKKNIIKRFLTK